ncbi:hypothetical protein SAMN00768000_0216 [Sulfobacillus thermosulfidooxidans DSM 9293]|uniref:Uncharacterized protein n=1 Tax=Sulfobacillus thermosulfidooxidans (strain DSM 9293 / VKM B-1269 / AT-1) TaxID=929705 RepID=A0A1W1W6V4_SULTA|nr:hypothetical protein [Sulfobacillus thermosulfidooxidans]SMC02008.1 hypothetical protein SAMN00768000_0216 [Sulfobacillus thermosulfidooxidans DSM 9293]
MSTRLTSLICAFWDSPFLAIRTLATALVTHDDLWTCFIHSFRRADLRTAILWGYSVTLVDAALLLGFHRVVLHHPTWSAPLDGLMGALLILTAGIFLTVATLSLTIPRHAPDHTVLADWDHSSDPLRPRALFSQCAPIHRISLS